MFKKVKGFRDIFGDDIAYWELVEAKFKEIFPRFCYSEIKIPVLEKSELFVRGIGETTDIVEKEMFTFQDRDGSYLSLRPEGTASVVRAYIENKLYEPPSIKKYYYYGPMFRRERPQKGRFRQFYQLGVEAFGSESPLLDAEIIYLLYYFLNSFDLGDFLKMEINSIGCPDCRPKYKEKLIDYFKANIDKLCDDCKRRLDRNPMRILDCKIDSCKEVVKEAPIILDNLCDVCNEHFEKLKGYLRQFGVNFEVNPYIVRGLDYYVRTAFEMVTDKLGASSAVGAGGRYDGLIKDLGGPDIPGIGFAIGVDRLVELLKLKKEIKAFDVDVYVITFEDFTEIAINVCSDLRNLGIKTSLSYDLGSIKSEMKKANRLNAKYVIIIGDDEVKTGEFAVKNMETGEQIKLSKEKILEFFKNR
ncbi:histidine--tRNA ligase [Deferribacter thermophilus]|uniref:histidine--tRNA ligase n=1 Tax=Deferribacter thermophilus TaxID=53573 RepID=UPI003C19B23B